MDKESFEKIWKLKSHLKRDHIPLTKIIIKNPSEMIKTPTK